MISKERLKELIEKNAKIYHNTQFASISEINTKDIPIFYKLDNFSVWELFCDDYYETKEEAEFVQKFHTSKTVYFEPPTWEEFLKTETDDAYACWEIQKLAIIMDTELQCFFIIDNLSSVWESFSYTDENKKQKYYEALEYAKKLFLGEEKK